VLVAVSRLLHEKKDSGILRFKRRARVARRFSSTHGIHKEFHMTIKIGDRLPEGTLAEFIESATEGCSLGPNRFNVSELVKGKKIAIFGLPGAYTPTCSAQHVPGYVKHAEQFKAKGVDEIWCIAVNDAFVMGAWGRDQKATGIVRMMADGNADFSKALGLDADFSKFGMGTRSQRYSMLVEDGLVKKLNVEQPGQFEVSSAEALLTQLD
jgi:glutaredoxin/glutathione-dependent peroxiredoxin